MKKYRHVVLGGTFDLFHIGHERFFDKSFSVSTFVTIGLVSDKFTSRMGKQQLNNHKERSQILKKYLNNKGLQGRFSIITIDDVFGTTLVDKSIDGIVVTADSLGGGQKINESRVENKLAPLPIIKVALSKGNDDKVISSTRILKGEINEYGFNFLKFLHDRGEFFLPSKLRSQLGKPFGRIYKSIPKEVSGVPFFTVGDNTTKLFVEAGQQAKISIIDFKIQRERVFSKLEHLGFGKTDHILKVKNPPAVISRELIRAISEAVFCDQKVVIVVDGEEDLAVLPLALLSPVNTKIFYGLRNKGLVCISVNLQKKHELLEILSKFN